MFEVNDIVRGKIRGSGVEVGKLYRVRSLSRRATKEDFDRMTARNRVFAEVDPISEGSPARAFAWRFEKI